MKRSTKELPSSAATASASTSPATAATFAANPAEAVAGHHTFRTVAGRAEGEVKPHVFYVATDAAPTTTNRLPSVWSPGCPHATQRQLPGSGARRRT